MKQFLILLFSLFLFSCSTEYKIRKVERITVRHTKKYLKNVKKGKIEIEYPDSTLYPVSSN
jgi:hypothetical protein